MSEFFDTILPGNYRITKSMEFNRIQTCGTLWYLKKWMVYYNYIIMNRELYDNVYDDIVKIFDEFINSLPQDIQSKAIDFFYGVDIRDKDKFMKFSEFSYHTTFSTKDEEYNYYNTCKKYYFMYLMDIGGQAGYKKVIKDLLKEKKSYFDIKTTIEREMISKGESQKNIKLLFSDFPAAIRNERQIFYYYGFIYGGENEINGFNRPTYIGNLAVKANYHELLLIWEHQKLKMISQSPVTEIGNLSPKYNDLNIDKFGISYHPYCILLNLISKRGGIDYDEYKYLISRIKNNNIDFVGEITSTDIKKIKSLVESFNRKADIEDEDYQKEIKKYLLGIMNLKLDEETNYYSCLKYDSSNIQVKNVEKLNFLCKVYNILIDYLNNEYLDDYHNFEDFLTKKYKGFIMNNEISHGEYLIAKYDWIRYIITIDKVLLSHLVYIGISMKNSCLNFSLTEEIFKNEYDNYKGIIQLLGFESKQAFSKAMTLIQNNLSSNSYYIKEIDEDSQLFEGNISIPIISEDVLKQLSDTTPDDIYIDIDEKKERSAKLRTGMLKYYLANYLESDGYIKCDCCGGKTFKKNDDIPYLEFHHIIPFKQDNGPDHYLNLVGICPNCHKKFHFIKNTEKNNLYTILSANNHLKKDIESRLHELYDLNILRPWHLDFLLKENAISDSLYEKFMTLS